MSVTDSSKEFSEKSDLFSVRNRSETVFQSVCGPSLQSFGQKWKDNSEVIITFLSGFSAGTISRTITAPLDRLKLLMQEGRILQHTMTHPTCHILNSKIKNNANYSYSLFQLVKIILKEGANPKEEVIPGVGSECTSACQAIRVSFMRFKSSFMSKLSSLGVFWRGNGINCIKAGPEFALAFGTRQVLQQLFFPSANNEGNLQRTSFSSQFTVSAAAGATAQIIIYPLELIKTRMAVASSAEYTSIIDCIRQTYQNGVSKAAKKLHKLDPSSSKPLIDKRGRKQSVPLQREDILSKLSFKQYSRLRAIGLSEFYRGLGANLTGIVPNRGVEMGLFFYLGDTWKLYAGQHDRTQSMPLKMSLLIGATSSTTAQIVTYPLNLIRLRMQVQGMSGRPILYKNMLHCFCCILRKEGYQGLYRGLLPNLLKGVPSSTTMYVVFQSTKNFLKENLQ